MRPDVLALPPHPMQRLLHHEWQLVFEMRRTSLVGVAVPESAPRLLCRGEFDRADNRLPLRRVIFVADLACERNRPEQPRTAGPTIARHVRGATGKAEHITPLHIER